MTWEYKGMKRKEAHHPERTGAEWVAFNEGYNKGKAEALREIAEELDAFEADEDLEPGQAVCMILDRAEKLEKP